ncbi:PQQ-dependent sugar dehydrogenase [Agaribacter flavus]|uniref:PQQ-dependent sugar dehydrogenase n=1 Tax=Agaribacter flavus TaxID=1902781 RepID=A0ABV7FQ21_9ALTE
MSAVEYILEPVLSEIPLSSSLSVLPSGDIVIVHKKGGLTLLSSQVVAETNSTLKFSKNSMINLVPDDLYVSRQGGLIAFVAHPNYEKNGWLYLSYAAGTANKNFLKIVRFRLNNNTVTDQASIFRVAQDKDTPVHFGGKMAFSLQGHLLVTSGDGFDYREKAQVLSNQLGKVLRMSDTGEALIENPYYVGSTAHPDTPKNYVFTLGHRNPQALLVRSDGVIVSNEHGPKGGDEINVLEAGVNYGWPVVTNGTDYIGASISPFKNYKGMRLPNYDWTPSIAPSSMVFYEGGKFPELRNHYLITSLKLKNIYLVTKDFTSGHQATLFSAPQTRLRDIAVLPSGDLIVLSDGENATLSVLKKR